MVVIILNSITLGIEYYDQPEAFTTFLKVTNIVFTVIFTLEMLVMQIGDGFINYWFEMMCIFDGIIVAISWVEVFFLAESSGFSVLRGFRLLRIFKLMRRWKSLKRVMKTLLDAIP